MAFIKLPKSRTLARNSDAVALAAIKMVPDHYSFLVR